MLDGNRNNDGKTCFDEFVYIFQKEKCNDIAKTFKKSTKILQS
jgi:hypothetical protein